MLTTTLSILKLHLKDELRMHNASGLAALLKSFEGFHPNARKQMNALIRIALYYPNTRFGQYAIRKANEKAKKVLPQLKLTEQTEIIRSAIIKPYVSSNEPGFLMVSFETELDKLIRLKRFDELTSQYRIIFLPTWQPFYTESMCLLAARSKYPYFIMPSAFIEQKLCETFSPKSNYLPFHAASWVNDEFYDSPKEKTIDLLMVANFLSYKRHWKLFEALKHLPKSLRVVLAGVPIGNRTKGSLLKEARLFGVDDRFTIIEGATDEELKELLRSAKLFCAMTHKEGSYIAVAESCMAGTPVAMFDSAKIGTKAYINNQTGILLSYKKPLHSQLEKALSIVDGLTPQRWAKMNISAKQNSQKLNDHLKTYSFTNGLNWTTDIEPIFCKHFNFNYFNQQRNFSMSNEYTRLQHDFGLAVKQGV